MTTKTPDVVRMDAEELGVVIEELEAITDAASRIGDLAEAKVNVNLDDRDLAFVFDGQCWFVEVPTS